MFEIFFSNQAEKFLRKCDQDLCQRILQKIKLLKEEPVPHDAKRIIGEEKTFRIRVGDYRTVYEVKWKDNKILIADIDKRSRIYS